MPRVIYTAVPLVWIEVRGHKADESQANRDDGGLIARLEAFLESVHIHPLRLPKVPHGIASTGRYSYGFATQVAPHVIAWLKANGATEGHEAPGET